MRRPVEMGVREASGCGARIGFGSCAKYYELLSGIFSAGLIKAAKDRQLEHLTRDSKVLYLGVGAGEDAFHAAKRGLEVTCIDISGGMLDQLQKKLKSNNLQCELICEDALRHDRLGYYDSVVCNFFLNCFQEGDCKRMLAHAASLLRNGGTLLISDVAAPRGSLVSRAIARTYIKSGMFFYWLCGMVSMHGIYDYRNYFQQNGLELIDSAGFRLCGIGPVVFENLAARKNAVSSKSI